MYLKALELQGFKSFPEKTRLSFEKDITVIVGPNGSGKSNLSDALLWVMGEQKTRMLRGGKMEDVIFGGTEKRGAMGFAQVTLVLDNTTRILPLDTDEVSIARRYYRSGESEYYINREQVRLRDVTELPVIGTVSLIHNEARTQKERASLRRFFIASAGLVIAYGLGTGILMFLSQRAS